MFVYKIRKGIRKHVLFISLCGYKIVQFDTKHDEKWWLWEIKWNLMFIEWLVNGHVAANLYKEIYGVFDGN